MWPTRIPLPFFFLTLVLTGFSSTQASNAAQLKVLHAFCGDACGGSAPQGVIRDGSGNLYGTAASAGRNQGTVYELVGGKKLKVLHSFPHDGSDGSRPGGPLVIDTSGNLYGVSVAGGAHGEGNVFELSPPAAGAKKWTFRVLYSFCAQQNCADGAGPSSGLTYAGAASGAPYDGSSPLYGETFGIVYQLSPGEQGWTEDVLASFCLEGGQCTGGYLLTGGLYLDNSGNLFGTTAQGGNSNNSGVAFELSQSGGAWTERVLYTFCSQHDCKDGKYPYGLVQDTAGNLYGATAWGGRPCSNAALNGQTCGVLYQLTFNGTSWQQTVLYTFCSKNDCKDGAQPSAPLSLDSSGNLVGTTYGGGGHDIDFNGEGGGVVFRYGSGAYTALYSFCKQANCADGEYPEGSLISDPSGNLLGTTIGGGPDGGGEVFRLTPSRQR